jgi:hypothetical protein
MSNEKKITSRNGCKVTCRRGLRHRAQRGYVYAVLASVYAHGEDVHSVSSSVEHHVGVLSTLGLTNSFTVDHRGYGGMSSFVGLGDLLVQKHKILSELLGRWSGIEVRYTLPFGDLSACRPWVASVIGADGDECEWYAWDGAVGKGSCSPVGVRFDCDRDREYQHDIYSEVLARRIAGRFVRSAVVVRWDVEFVLTAGRVSPARFLNSARATDIVSAGFGHMVLER